MKTAHPPIPPASRRPAAPPRNGDSARAGRPGPRRRAAARARIVFQLGLVARPPCSRDGPQSPLLAFDRLLKPASGRLKGASSFDGSLRPDEPPDARTARPAPGGGQRQALRPRLELAPGKAGRYRRGNCPGCGNAPIEACCKADGLRFVLDVTHDYCRRSSRCW